MTKKPKHPLDAPEQEIKEVVPAGKSDDFIPSDLLRDINQRLGRKHKDKK
ncbi:hypothetical protein [Hafnia paralvei]|jgi:hypothetical protein|nr:hypothetical protein [Hafnia paralvei]MDN5449937.1 hypothetical protein [Enterobacterales bacterium]MDN6018651.1 hypothetical protein [Enterobacterales bacterium]